MNIKPLDKSYVSAASDLIGAVAKEFSKNDFTEEGFAIFESKVLYDGMERNIENGYLYWGAFEENRLLGVIAIKPPAHLYNLFVDKDSHNRGIASSLWNHVLQEMKPSTVTVYSSTYAIDLYIKLGFVPTGSKVEDKGIICFPMQWEAGQNTD